MSAAPLRLKNVRQAPRVTLPPMYTLLRVRFPGDSRYRWVGHIYDISQLGMRFEIDQLLPENTVVEIRAMLPGKEHTSFRAEGKIVRIHDAEPGPVRMAMTFDSFETRSDRDRLTRYLSVQAPAAETGEHKVTHRRAA